MITALCGGVGGSKLALGLYRNCAPGELTIIGNTADDMEFHGLWVSPDLDTVTYTLAGLSRRDVGWGIEGDTFAALEMLGKYAGETWFQVGDRDLATHVVRTHALRNGRTLTEITADVSSSLGVTARILPMTDSPVSTRLLVGDEWLHFQDYFVRRRHSDPVKAARYVGIEEAEAPDGVQGALQDAEVVVIVNSNPVLSILPILAVAGVNDVLASVAVPRVAVSPLVGTGAVTGPAGELMSVVGQPASATGVANAYLGFLDGIVIDHQDAGQRDEIESLGLQVLCTDTIMRTEDDKQRLAHETLEFARGLR